MIMDDHWTAATGCIPYAKLAGATHARAPGLPIDPLASLTRSSPVRSVRTQETARAGGSLDAALYAPKAPSVVGQWSVVADPTAACGERRSNANLGAARSRAQLMERSPSKAVKDPTTARVSLVRGAGHRSPFDKLPCSLARGGARTTRPRRAAGVALPPTAGRFLHRSDRPRSGELVTSACGANNDDHTILPAMA